MRLKLFVFLLINYIGSRKSKRFARHRLNTCCYVFFIGHKHRHFGNRKLTARSHMTSAAIVGKQSLQFSSICFCKANTIGPWKNGNIIRFIWKFFPNFLRIGNCSNTLSPSFHFSVDGKVWTRKRCNSHRFSIDSYFQCSAATQAG